MFNVGMNHVFLFIWRHKICDLGFFDYIRYSFQTEGLHHICNILFIHDSQTTPVGILFC